jgi:hypothetical protein
MHDLLGLEVWQSTEKIFLNEGKYAVKMKRFDMLNVNPCTHPWKRS